MAVARSSVQFVRYIRRAVTFPWFGQFNVGLPFWKEWKCNFSQTYGVFICLHISLLYNNESNFSDSNNCHYSHSFLHISRVSTWSMVVISKRQVSATCNNQIIHKYKSLLEKNRQIRARMTVMAQRWLSRADSYTNQHQFDFAVSEICLLSWILRVA